MAAAPRHTTQRTPARNQKGARRYLRTHGLTWIAQQASPLPRTDLRSHTAGLNFSTP